MRTTSISFSLLLLLAIVRSVTGGLFEDKRLADVPLPARQTITTVLGPGRLSDLVLTNENGHPVYEAEMHYRGIERNFSVLPDGTLMMKQTFLNELPPPVQETVKRETKGAKDLNIYWLHEEGEPYYFIEFKKDQQQSSFSVALDGWITSRQIAFENLPATVQTSIRQKLDGRMPSEIARAVEGDEITFEVTEVVGEVEKLWLFNPDGTTLAEPIAWNALPEAARTTLAKQSIGSRIIYLFRVPRPAGELYETWFVRNDAKHVCTVDSLGRIESEELPVRELGQSIRDSINSQAAGRFIVRIEKQITETGASYEVTLRDKGKIDVVKITAEPKKMEQPGK